MKKTALRFACALLASLAIAAAAAPAQAGLDFTDTATSASGGTPDFTFNGSTTVGTTVSMTNGFGVSTGATISSTNASGSIVPTLARVVFSYTGGFDGIVAADWSVDHGDPAYNMVVEFGTITIGAGGAASLQAIEFDEGSGFSPSAIWNINQSLTAADSNLPLHINVPSSVIALTSRDLVQAVRLTFLFTGGSGTSIDVTAVVNPEPGTMALFGLGLVGMAAAVRARRKKRPVAAN
jgi:hypothetical protein